MYVMVVSLGTGEVLKVLYNMPHFIVADIIRNNIRNKTQLDFNLFSIPYIKNYFDYTAELKINNR